MIKLTKTVQYVIVVNYNTSHQRSEVCNTKKKIKPLIKKIISIAATWKDKIDSLNVFKQDITDISDEFEYLLKKGK